MNKQRFSADKRKVEKKEPMEISEFLKIIFEVKNSLEALVYWRSQMGNDIIQKPVFTDRNEYYQKY